MGMRRQWQHGTRGLLGLWCTLVLGVSTSSLALEPGRRLSQYNHESWRSENGLAQNSVLSSAQTPDGYLWFGTYEGLARFDGARFTIFNQQNSPEMVEREIIALAVDATGMLWVGTHQGLLRYEEGQLRRPPQPDLLAEVPITGLAADSKAMWISSPRGVVRAPTSSKEPWRIYTAEDGLPGSGIGPIVSDGSGGVWGATAQGLARVSGDMVEVLALPPEGSPQVKSLWLARDGTLWIGTAKGLLCFREGQFIRYGPEQQMPETMVAELLEDRDGNLWVGTGRGLLRRTAAGFSAVTYPKVLAISSVNSLLEDRSGHLWIGTLNEGVHRLSNGPFVPLGEPEGSTASDANLVLEMRDGTLWMAPLSEGLERMKDGNFTRMGTAQGLPNQRVRALAEGPDGVLWVGTPSGVFHFDGERFVPLGPEHGMPANALIWAMAPEPGGMWFATSKGLAWLHDGRVTVYGPQQGFVSEPVMTMLREDLVRHACGAGALLGRHLHPLHRQGWPGREPGLQPVRGCAWHGVGRHQDGPVTPEGGAHQHHHLRAGAAG
jgi:ligand-binding sensor domain-containing protein